MSRLSVSLWTVLIGGSLVVAGMASAGPGGGGHGGGGGGHGGGGYGGGGHGGSGYGGGGRASSNYSGGARPSSSYSGAARPSSGYSGTGLNSGFGSSGIHFATPGGTAGARSTFSGNVTAATAVQAAARSGHGWVHDGQGWVHNGQGWVHSGQGWVHDGRGWAHNGVWNHCRYFFPFYGFGFGYPWWYAQWWYDPWWYSGNFDPTCYLVYPAYTNIATAPDDPPPDSPVAMTVAGNQSRLQVFLPDPNAQVLIDGHRTSSTGTTRYYDSPGLDPGQVFSYRVTASWSQNGQPVLQERTVPVSAGEVSVVDFTRP